MKPFSPTTEPDGVPPLRRLAAGAFAGAAAGLALFGAGWFLLVGAAPPVLGWAVGGVLAAFAGSELGSRAAAAGCQGPTDADPTHDSPPAAAVPPPDGVAPPGRTSWQDRVHPTVDRSHVPCR